MSMRLARRLAISSTVRSRGKPARHKSKTRYGEVTHMPALSGSVVSLQVGRVAPLGAEGSPSGFVKRPVAGPVMAERLGLAGDEQADRRVHGGAEKAIYWYPVGHYVHWCALLPHHAATLVAGAFGENLTIEEFDEDDVAIGDIFRVGRATLQITEPRQPCLKLALRFDDPRLVKAMIRTGMTGWYTRVLEAGQIEAGAAIDLLDRPNPEWSIPRFNRFINNHGGTAEELAELAKLRGLPRAWQRAAHAALGTVLRAHTKEFSSQAPAPTVAQDPNLHP